MGVLCGVRNQFIHKKRCWYRLIKRDFDSTFYGDMESALWQGFRKALADIIKVRTEINFFEHLGLVKSLVSPSDGSDAIGSLIKMQSDLIAHSRRFQMEHACY